MRLVISLSLGVILLLFGSFSAAQTDAVDQAALIAFWNALTNKGTLGWNTAATTGLCEQNGIICVNQKVQTYNLGLAFGSLHFVSLDGTHFTFSGLGEFALVESAATNFTIQIRTAALPAPANTTSIIAVVVKYQSSLVGVYLDQFGAFALAFNGVYQSPPLYVGDQILLPGGFITVTLTSNNILQVYSFNGVITTITSGPLGGITSLSLQVLVPNTLQSTNSGSQLNGLLGPFDGNPANDLTFQNGTVLPASSASSEVYPFGLSWMITNSTTSWFAYPSGLGSANYNHPTFVPDFPENLGVNSLLSSTAQQACQVAGAGFSGDCYFDILESQSYSAGSVAIAFGLAYEGYLTGIDQPPVFFGLPSSSQQLGVYLNQVVSVSFSVSDPQDNPFSVFVSSTPVSSGGTFDYVHATYTYTFTVSSELFLSSSLTPLKFTAVDSLGATSTASVLVSIAYTSCSGSMSQVKTEATTELNYFCVAGASTCSAGCKSVLVRLTGLICYSTLVSEIGSSLSVRRNCAVTGVAFHVRHHRQTQD